MTIEDKYKQNYVALLKIKILLRKSSNLYARNVAMSKLLARLGRLQNYQTIEWRNQEKPVMLQGINDAF